jgi:hypothetical protein
MSSNFLEEMSCHCKRMSQMEIIFYIFFFSLGSKVMWGLEKWLGNINI